MAGPSLRAEAGKKQGADLSPYIERIKPLVAERLDLVAASRLSREELLPQVSEIVADVLAEERLPLNGQEHSAVVERLLDDMPWLSPGKRSKS